MEERLTEKYDDNTGYGVKEDYPCEQHLYIDFNAYDRCIQTLGQYEDIEEELGIDLRVYHKLMGMLYCGDENKLYVKDKDTIVEVGILEIDYCKKKILFYKDKNYNDDYVYGFGQYGKAWAFTAEELE